MTTTVLTSELEAVNTILELSGESPVQSLALSGLLVLDRAKAKLDETVRLVLAPGWTFNTNTDVTLARNISNEIPVATSWLKVDPNPEFMSYKVSVRGNKLWNGKTNAWTFDRDLKGTVVDLLAWDSLPQAARHYIMVSAARAYQRSGFGSSEINGFTQEDEQKALLALNEFEADTGNFNMLRDSWDGQRIVQAYEYGYPV